VGCTTSAHYSGNCVWWIVSSAVWSARNEFFCSEILNSLYERADGAGTMNLSTTHKSRTGTWYTDARPKWYLILFYVATNEWIMWRPWDLLVDVWHVHRVSVASSDFMVKIWRGGCLRVAQFEVQLKVQVRKILRILTNLKNSEFGQSLTNC